MAFDVEEYAKKRRQNNSTDSEDNGNRNSGFDVEEYVKQRNLPQVGEYLTSSINSWLKKNESFVNSYNTRYSGENTTYRADASDWLSSVATQKSSLSKEADSIRNILDQYKDYLDKDYYSSVKQALDGNLKMQGDILSASTKDYEYWSQWETEDAYKEYVAQQEDYNKKLTFDLRKGEVEINDLQAIIGEFDRLQKSINATNNGIQVGARGYANEQERAALQARYDELTAIYGDPNELASTLSEKKAYFTLAERVQKAAELASVADVNSQNYDPAFATKSQYQSTEASGFGKLFSMYGMGYEDLTYEYINGDEDFRAEVNQKHNTWTMDNPNVGGDTKSMFKSAGYDHMTEDEIAIYNYYYNTAGKEKAQEYLDSLEESLQVRYGTAMAEGMKGKPVAQYIFAVEAGLDQFASGVAGIFADGYTPASATQVASGMVREDLADTGAKLPDWLGGASLGQVGYDVINTTSNMLPSILASTAVNAVAPGAGAVVGAGLMGASAGGNAKAEMLNLGYSKEQATTYGLMVGVAEGSMEYLLGGISKLGGVLPDGIVGKVLTKVDNAFARTAIKIGGSMLSEGFEEGLQTVIEPWLKEIATGVDWEDPSIDEVLYSSLLGALSAFGLEGAGVVAGEVGTYKSGKNVQKVEGGVAKLQAIGSTFSADTVAYKIAGKVNAQTDAYTIGRLLNEVGGTISEQNVTEIVNGLTQRGMDTNTATKLAKQYQAFLNNEMRMTDDQVKILENLSPLADVLRTNIIGSNTTVYQRTRSYSDLMNLADEVSNGKKGVTTKKTSEVQKTSTNIFEQNDINTELHRIASEVATGSRASASERAVKKVVNSASSAAAEKLGVEGRYTSSETGSTRLASNKGKVSVVGVDSIEDGVMKVKLNDGSVVSADEIDFSSSDEALVYEAVTNMGVNPTTAWEILKAYDPKSGQSGTIYAMGALEAYTYGHNGVKVDGMSKDGFSALLSPMQKNTANRLGDIDARAKVEAQQKTLDKAVKTVRDEAKSKGKAIPRRKGETVFEGDRARLTDLQQSQLGVLEKVSDGLGVTFHIFESKVDAEGKRYYTMPDGTITSANGWYDPKTGEIWIDLYAGNDGQGTMIFTAAHELTHFIRQWSPAKFKVFADFLLEQYGKKGQDVNQLIRDQMQKAANNGRSIGWDEAYEEVVADSAETFLRDSKAAEKIAALREKDAGLANKIKSFLGQMLAKMRKVMADLGLAPETKEGKMVAEMTDSLQKLYDLWTDALADAGTAYSTIDKNLMENGIAVDSSTESASLMSVRYLLGSNQQQKVAEALAERFGVTVQEAKGWIDAETSLASIILNPKYSQYLDYTADENEEAIKSNSDYPQGTVDFSNICKKRRDFTEVMNRLLRNFPNHVFEATDLAKIRTIMSEEGMEVACGICYVEDRRQLDSIVAQDFIDSLALYRNGSKTRPDGKPFNANQLKAFKLIEGDSYTPSIYELISLEGRNSLKAKNPAMEEAWVKFNNARGMQSVRLLLNDAEYKRQILKYSPAVVKRKNDLGGLRIYSFSDMEMFHLIDIIQVITDSAAVGLSIQGYTKVNEYARAVKDTGEKLNRSLIPKGDLGYHMENGKVVLDYDTVEGIDINHPDFFDNIDNPNVGNIVIGINATQIKAAMTSKFIDQIIPFHTGQSNEVLGEKGIATWVNYKDSQSERDVKTGKKSAHQINIYTEVINAAEAEGHPITNKVEFVNKFLEVCKKNGLIPRFSDFLNVDENGDFIYTEGYHKFLVDFKTFDQNTGEYLPQKPVKPIFDNEYITQLLKDYAKTQKVKDAKFAENMPKVLERITTEIVKSDGVKFSNRDSEGNTLSKDQQEFFKDSKVIDADTDGLMVLYHGSRNPLFTEFNIEKGVWLTPDQRYAEVYADMWHSWRDDFGDTPLEDRQLTGIEGEVYADQDYRLYKMYANIINPLDLGEIDEELTNKGIAKLARMVSVSKADIQNIIDTYDCYMVYDVTRTEEYIEMAHRKGYDGFSATESGKLTFCVFNAANQVKLTSNKNPTSNPDIRYSFRAYTDKQKENWKNAKRIVLYDNEAQFRDFIDKARNINDFNKKMYFGAIPSDLAELIQSETGINVENFNCSLSAYEIKKIFKDHGDEAKEAPRGQRAITEDDIFDIPKVILSPDDITLSDKKYEGKPVIEFSKQTNGKLTVAAVVSDKHLDLFVQTAYAGIKKGNLATPIGEQAPINTPKASSGTVSTNRIPHFEDSVNSETKKNSLRDSYAPTFYSHMGKVVDGIKLDKIGANSLVPFLKGKGVKNEEIKWSGIEAWLEGKKSVTKAELQAFIAGSQLQIEEQMSGRDIELRYDHGTDSYTVFDGNGDVIDTYSYDSNLGGYKSENDDEVYEYASDIENEMRYIHGSDDAPRHSQYKLDGGSNYRELVFKMPDATYSNNAMRGHWGQEAEGVLAHARIQDMDTSDGKKMLFIEEIQSDWHNEGREKGYTTKEYEDAVAVYDRLAEDYANKRRAFNKYVRSSEFRSDSDEVSKKKFDWLRRKMDDAEKRMQGAERDIEDLKKKGMGDVPDAPFRTTYHEYVLKRLLRMAAEEGYDSLGWTTADIQSERWSEDYAEGYRIEYDQDIPSFLKKYGKKWGASVGKTTINGDTDVWSMPITNSMKNSVLGEGQAMFSDRSPGSVSTRSLLANALETTAQNDIEKNKLEQYKKKIGLIESEYAKLTEIRAEIKELSFAKGKRDTARIKDLQFQANQTANRINTYDRQLLNLESTTALKNVLNREKELARRKEAQKGKDALAKYKEKAAKTQRELMDRNTESRKKAIESRNKTEMRHKIKKVVGDLKTLLLDETKDKHVPIGLQKPVAEALDIINMDTMGADERVAKYNAMIHKAKDPDIIAELTKSRDRIALQGESLSDKLTALKQAYADIKNSDDPLIRDAHNEAIEDLIANTAEKVGNTSLRDMSYEQLETVYDMYKAILATVRNANKLFKADRQETITDNSESVKREVRAAGGHRDRVLKATKFLKKFGWNMLKPIYAMKLIGSDTLTRLYENVRKGEDTWAVDVNEAKDFFKETAKKYEYNTWDFKKSYKFTDSVGYSFSLTLEQIMSLYAYSKRSQADKHLEFGGFIFDDAIEVTKKTKLGIPMKYEVNDANPYRLKKDDLGKIISLLDTDLNNVKGFVDEMQAYLSDVMGAKGNEVSLAMYDIKLYKEQNYFPLKTARYFREFDPEKNGTPKIKNSGFSKKTVPQAGNPIILSNFMDVWANHINDMSMYHAFVLPLEDFMRVYNYSSTAGGYDSVQQYIKNAYGSQANTYIETLMSDLNGGARTDPATDFIGKHMALFKKAAVFASASVVIQQPSAIARAMAYVDAKYFVDKPEATKHSNTWAEVKKYAPVAIIKEMGYFDTNMGRSTVDWIKEEKTIRDRIDDVASKAPALADELAWCAIWKAVKREVAATTKLKVGSEEFLKMAGKRFTEVVTKTQVYDSVLSRSALMRSKDTGAKMVTAFMAEPTTSLNMVVDAIIEGKRGNKRFARQAVGAVATSIILNSILVSLVTAARDDDDDETYTEKYLESLTAELLDGFNPLTYIPLIKDIWSIMQGYDIERSDMSIWSDLWASVENLFSDNKSGFEKTEGIVGSIASMFGLPLKNLMRDARGMYNLASTLLSGTPTTKAGVGEAIGGAVKDSIPLYSRIEKFVGADESKSDKLYDAIMSGDQKHIDRVKAQYKDDKAIETAIRKGLRENDSRIHEAAQARYDGDVEEYKRIAKEIIAEGYFSQDTVVAAINAEINAIKKGETTEEDQTVDATEKVTSIYKASDINLAFDSGDTDMALEVIDDLIKTKVANGMTEKEAKASLRSSMTSYWKPLYKEAYKSGNTAEQERIKRFLKESGLYGNVHEVIKTIREWRSERD